MENMSAGWGSTWVQGEAALGYTLSSASVRTEEAIPGMQGEQHRVRSGDARQQAAMCQLSASTSKRSRWCGTPAVDAWCAFRRSPQEGA